MGAAARSSRDHPPREGEAIVRGLTPAELEALVYAAGSRKEPFDSGSPRHSAMLDLREQGRVVAGPSHLSDRPFATGWHITPAGREALRLWPAVQAARGGQP